MFSLEAAHSNIILPPTALAQNYWKMAHYSCRVSPRYIQRAGADPKKFDTKALVSRHGLEDNVLEGKYGAIPQDLTVNTSLRLSMQEQNDWIISSRPLLMPAVGIAAVLGHHQVVYHLV